MNTAGEPGAVQVKICGVTTVEDARLVSECGADYLGVIVEVEASPRSVKVGQAVEIGEAISIPTVALFLNPDTRAIEETIDRFKPYALQLHGEESPARVALLKGEASCQIWKTVHLPDRAKGGKELSDVVREMREFIEAGADCLVLDTMVVKGGVRQMGGTGVSSDWELARDVVRSVDHPVFLAGGIRCENVREAIECVRPFGIDVSSGVETKVGRKDRERLIRLMSIARRCGRATLAGE